MNDETENPVRLFVLLFLFCLAYTIGTYIMASQDVPKQHAHQVIIFPHPENAS